MKEGHESREVDGGIYDLISMTCRRCRVRIDWCKCRLRRRKRCDDGVWR